MLLLAAVRLLSYTSSIVMVAAVVAVVVAVVTVILATIAADDIISIILYYRRRHDMNIRKTDISFTSNFTAFPTLEVPVASVRYDDGVVTITAIGATLVLVVAVILLL